VREVCADLERTVVNQVYSVDDLIDDVGHFVARKFRVNVLHAKALEVEASEVNINAFYDAERDERKKISIELVFVTNPNDDYLILDEDLWTLLVNRLADSLAHELIHMRQARDRDFLSVDHRSKRNIAIDENLVYLSDPDEIDAYAYNIATELREHANPIQKLQNPKAVTIVDSVNLWAYINAFAQNISNPVVKKLLKKIYKLLT
jgi:hypothetical protein